MVKNTVEVGSDITNREEEMILDDLRDGIKILNANTLYLCKHVTSSEERLRSIEDNMKLNDTSTSLCMSKVNKIEGKLMGASMFIAIVISLIISTLT